MTVKKLSGIFCVLISFVGAILIAIIAPFYTWLARILVIILPLMFLSYFCLNITPKKNKLTEKVSKLFAIGIITLFFLETLFYIFYLSGILEHFRDIESASRWIQSFGALSWIIFFTIQFLQVIILPIPAQITIIAGILLFGALQTFVISSAAVVLGSLLCFYIGRLFGNKLLYMLFEKETVNHYRNILSSKGKFLLPIFFVLPIFPDDLLCFASGATNMKFNTFLTITLIFRPIAIAFICLFGSGKVIPFSSWGIPVWIVIFIVIAVIMVLFLKYQKQIEDWFVKKFTKVKK